MDDEDYETWLDGYKEHGLTWEEWRGKLTNNRFVSNKLGNKKVFITEQAIEVAFIMLERSCAYARGTSVHKLFILIRRFVFGVRTIWYGVKLLSFNQR